MRLLGLLCLFALVLVLHGRAAKTRSVTATQYTGQFRSEGRFGIGHFNFVTANADRARVLTFDVPHNCERDLTHQDSLRIEVKGVVVYDGTPCDKVALEVAAGVSMNVRLLGHYGYTLDVTER